jgi:hypothetical protein
VAAGQLGLTGGAQPIFFPNSRKTSIKLLLEAQQHKKYARTTPVDDVVSSLFSYEIDKIAPNFVLSTNYKHYTFKGLKYN